MHMRVHLQKWQRIVLITGAVATTAGLLIYRLFYPGTSFLSDYMTAGNFENSYTTSETAINLPTQSIPVRIYTPSQNHIRSTILLVHGVHNDGYNESRLIHFTSTLVHHGYRVVTPDIRDLKQYQIVTGAVDDIEAVARWLANKSKLLKPNEKFGMWGISFAGGLCLSVAAMPDLQDRISSGFSFGGHGDLDSTMHYLMTGNMPEGRLPPHIYGQAVLVRQYASQLVPEDQVAPLRETIYLYLKGEYKKATARSKLSAPESRELLQLIFDRDVKVLGKRLQSKTGNPETGNRLSAVKGPSPKCTVHLLHGSTDNVIPPSELNRLQQWAAAGGTTVYALVSSLINHVELEEDTSFKLIEYLRIIRFWTELLRHT
ncbi:MAG: hypothetical protein JXX14_22985 [Deltaproteobacteria bacterium]|nr:hypothetical protein [Deltaproteobacteria bacterium]